MYTKAYFKGIRLLLKIIIMKIESDGTRIFYLSHSIFFIKGIGMALAVNGRKYADFQNCKLFYQELKLGIPAYL